MRIVIAGCGKIGQSMIHSLVSEGHEIVVIDSDREVIDCVTTNYDVMGICSQATSCKRSRKRTSAVRSCLLPRQTLTI